MTTLKRALIGIGALAVVLLVWTASAAAAGTEQRTLEREDRRPNIVLIMADDVSPEMFGCYGSADAKTPNLDRMAEEGVMFQTAWASAQRHFCRA